MARRRRRRNSSRRSRSNSVAGSGSSVPANPQASSPITQEIAQEIAAAEPDAPEEQPSAPAANHEADLPADPESELTAESPRVLAVYPNSSVLRLIRESLEAFTDSVVDTTPTTKFGFELAMQRNYALVFLGLKMPMLDGPVLYDFIASAYAFNGDGARPLPGVFYLLDESTGQLPQDVRQEARVHGTLFCPFEIGTLLETVNGLLSRKQVGELG